MKAFITVLLIASATALPTFGFAQEATKQELEATKQEEGEQIRSLDDELRALDQVNVNGNDNYVVQAEKAEKK